MSAEPGRLAEAAGTLHLDVVAAQVCARLTAAGVPVRLLRGPAIREALYPDGGRGYVDIDVLVPWSSERAAWSVVREMGFGHLYDGVALTPSVAVAVSRRRDARRGRYVSSWAGPDGMASLEIHTSLLGIGCHPHDVWPVLAEGGVPVVLPGATAPGLAPAALALTIALHAAQHGEEDARHLEDLRRAVAMLPAAVWSDAAAAARRLRALPAFRGGLALLEEGAVVLATIDADDTEPVSSRLPRQRPRDLVRLAGAVLLPSADLQRWDLPLARTGRAGLIASYPRRLATKAASGATLARRAVAGSGVTSLMRPATLRAAGWAFRAGRAGRRQLRRDGGSTVTVTRAPRSRADGERLVRWALRTSGASCLVRATVLQEWHAENGRPRDVVIGVSAPSGGFAAHAWLDGDEYDADRYHEIARRPAAPRP